MAVSINNGFTTVNAELENYVPTWQVDEYDELVYEFTSLQYNGTDKAPMRYYDEDLEQDFENGFLRAGNLFYVRIENLPDLTIEEYEVRLNMRGSETPERWDSSYDYNQSAAWPEEFDGPILFIPVSTVPENSTQWFDFADEWNTVPGMTASYDESGQTFTLSGANSTLNVTSFSGVWDTSNGVMLSYAVDFLEGDEFVPFAFELNFLYFRDPGEWDLHWGVNEGDMFAYRWDDIEFNGSDSMPWMTEGEPVDMDDPNTVYEGDIVVFHINELADLTSLQGPPYWNGSVSTPSFTEEFDFEFTEVGTGRGGPRVWYPLIMLGNAIYQQNVIDDFEGIGGTVTVTGDILNLTLDDAYSKESAEWDLTTGILQGMYYEGEGPEGLTIVAEISLVYHFAPGVPTFAYTDSVSQRYVLDDITNGSRNYLDLGPIGDYDETIPEEDRPHFLLYEGDIFSVQLEHKDTTIPYLDQIGEEMFEWMWSGKTSHGYETRSPLRLKEPGLEMSFEEGPPAFMVMIPIGDSAWWDLLEDIYVDIGYDVHNTAEEFGISTFVDPYTVAVRWHKADGMMSYYYVDGDDPNTSNHMTWEMSRGTIIDQENLGWTWGVGVGSNADFEFLEIDIGGENQLQFGPDGSTTASVGDILTITFKEFGDLSDLEEGGPWALEDMKIKGETIEYMTQMEEPGFEFANFDQDENSYNGPPFAYHIIPIGDASYWNLLETMWSDFQLEMLLIGTYLKPCGLMKLVIQLIKTVQPLS
ncbi:MAG: hypothetical protein ACXAB7_01635 [Candidatus Kariarchaeaceae archaeon]